MTDNIQLYIRARPLNSRESNSEEIWKTSTDATRISCGEKEFKFDHVFDKGCNNEKVFIKLQPLLDSFVQGYNATIFAYGQTGSGKTHTISGSGYETGICSMALDKIFEFIDANSDRQFILRVSYLEIYNETLIDLLQINKKKLPDLKIRSDGQDNVYIEGLTESLVDSPEGILELKSAGDRRRRVAETKMNERSSRSHTIFTVYFESKLLDGDIVRTSQLNMVDLAGSERANDTGAQGSTFRESCHINKSLSNLCFVINALSEGKNQFVNYRDSKLTRYLQNSLGGNAKTVIICTVSPADRDQTMSTLRFASAAKCVKNVAVLNEVKANEEVIRELQDQIHELKEQLGLRAGPTDVKDLKEQLEHVQRNYTNLMRFSQIASTPSVNTAPAQTIFKRRQTWAPQFGGNSLPRLSTIQMWKTPAVTIPALTETSPEMEEEEFCSSVNISELLNNEDDIDEEEEVEQDEMTQLKLELDEIREQYSSLHASLLEKDSELMLLKVSLEEKNAEVKELHARNKKLEKEVEKLKTVEEDDDRTAYNLHDLESNMAWMKLEERARCSERRVQEMKEMLEDKEFNLNEVISELESEKKNLKEQFEKMKSEHVIGQERVIELEGSLFQLEKALSSSKCGRMTAQDEHFDAIQKLQADHKKLVEDYELKIMTVEEENSHLKMELSVAGEKFENEKKVVVELEENLRSFAENKSGDDLEKVKRELEHALLEKLKLEELCYAQKTESEKAMEQMQNTKEEEERKRKILQEENSKFIQDIEALKVKLVNADEEFVNSRKCVAELEEKLQKLSENKSAESDEELKKVRQELQAVLMERMKLEDAVRARELETEKEMEELRKQGEENEMKRKVFQEENSQFIQDIETLNVKLANADEEFINSRKYVAELEEKLQKFSETKSAESEEELKKVREELQVVLMERMKLEDAARIRELETEKEMEEVRKQGEDREMKKKILQEENSRLLQDVEALKMQLSTADEKFVNTCKVVAELEEKLQSLTENQFSESQEELKKVRQELEEAVVEKKKLEDAFRVRDSETETAIQELRQLEEEKEMERKILNEKNSQLVQDVDALKVKLSTADEKFSNTRKRVVELEEELQSLTDNQSAENEEELKNVRQELQAILVEKMKLEDDARAREIETEKEMEELRKLGEEKEAKRKVLEEEKSQLVHDVEVLKEKLSTADEKISNTCKFVDELEEKLRLAENQIKNKDKESTSNSKYEELKKRFSNEKSGRVKDRESYMKGLTVLKQKNEKLSEEVTSQNEELMKLRQELDEATALKQNHEMEIGNLRDRVTEFENAANSESDQKIEELKKLLSKEKTGRLKDREGYTKGLKLLKEKNEKLSEDVTSHSEELTKLRKELAETATLKDEYETEMNTLRNRVTKVENAESISSVECDQKVDELKNLLSKEKSERNKDKEGYTKGLILLKEKNEKLSGDVTCQNKELTKLQKELDKITALKEEYETEMNTLRSRLTELENTEPVSNSESQKIVELKEKLMKEKKGRTEDHEGYKKGLTKLMEKNSKMTDYLRRQNQELQKLRSELEKAGDVKSEYYEEKVKTLENRVAELESNSPDLEKQLAILQTEKSLLTEQLMDDGRAFGVVGNLLQKHLRKLCGRAERAVNCAHDGPRETLVCRLECLTELYDNLNKFLEPNELIEWIVTVYCQKQVVKPEGHDATELLHLQSKVDDITNECNMYKDKAMRLSQSLQRMISTSCTTCQAKSLSSLKRKSMENVPVRTATPLMVQQEVEEHREKVEEPPPQPTLVPVEKVPAEEEAEVTCSHQ